MFSFDDMVKEEQDLFDPLNHNYLNPLLALPSFCRFDSEEELIRGPSPQEVTFKSSRLSAPSSIWSISGIPPSGILCNLSKITTLFNLLTSNKSGGELSSKRITSRGRGPRTERTFCHLLPPFLSMIKMRNNSRNRNAG